MDVIALHRAGFTAAVAPLGTALGEYQLQELWRLGPEPVLCFDGDVAGQRAAARALRRALPLLRPGHSLRFARLPSGDDPDTLIRRGGRAAFEPILSAAIPMSQMLWESEVAVAPVDTPERRADLDRRLSEHAATIADPAVRDEYRRFVRDRLYEFGKRRRVAANSTIALSFAQGSNLNTADLGRPPTWFVSELEKLPRAPGRGEREALLAALLQTPTLVAEFSEEIAALDFPSRSSTTCGITSWKLRPRVGGAIRKPPVDPRLQAVWLKSWTNCTLGFPILTLSGPEPSRTPRWSGRKFTPRSLLFFGTSVTSLQLRSVRLRFRRRTTTGSG